MIFCQYQYSLQVSFQNYVWLQFWFRVLLNHLRFFGEITSNGCRPPVTAVNLPPIGYDNKVPCNVMYAQDERARAVSVFRLDLILRNLLLDLIAFQFPFLVLLFVNFQSLLITVLCEGMRCNYSVNLTFICNS